MARAPVTGAPRVLFVTHNFPRFVGDAAGSFVWRLARALIDRGAHVHVLAPAAAGLKERETIDGVSVQRVRYASEQRQNLAYEGTMAELVRSSWSAKFAFAQLLWSLRQATKRTLREAHRNATPYDVVHAHWWFPAGLALSVSSIGKGNRTPLVITMHGSDVRLARTKPIVHPLMRRVLSRANALTAVSTWLASEAQRIAPDSAVQVAPMPVDIAQFTADRPPLTVPPTTQSNAQFTANRSPSTVPPTTPTTPSSPPRILFVGRLNAQKGAADLCVALARSAHDVHCDIIGDGPDRDEVQQIAIKLGVDTRITWHGALAADQLTAFYQNALVTVMPSREEGLGLVAVESQLCGTPVIAYDSGGLPDVVQPEHGGVLVTTGDTAALARAIDSMADNPDEARAMGHRARERVLARFSPEQVADQYLQLYAAAVERPA